MNDMPEQQEWWETDLRRMFHGVWAASPHNEQRMTDAAIEAIKPIFARHRKMIVKEIREEIEGVWSDSVFHQDMTSTLKLMGSNEMRSAILSLPCLKENE